MFPDCLATGYRSFLEGRLRRESSLYKNLATHGQSPEVMIIACSDSRVAPEIVFEAEPGDMFVLRNIANIVPPCEDDKATTSFHGTSAAIEFAVQALKVKHIVVMGHASCGGVAAFAKNIPPLSKGKFISKWVKQLEPVREKVAPCINGEYDSWLRRLELGVIDYSLNNLKSFPCVKERLETGDLELHGAYFGIATGLLFVRDAKTGEYHPFLEEQKA